VVDEGGRDRNDVVVRVNIFERVCEGVAVLEKVDESVFEGVGASVNTGLCVAVVRNVPLPGRLRETAAVREGEGLLVPKGELVVDEVKVLKKVKVINEEVVGWRGDGEVVTVRLTVGGPPVGVIKEVKDKVGVEGCVGSGVRDAMGGEADDVKVVSVCTVWEGGNVGGAGADTLGEVD